MHFAPVQRILGILLMLFSLAMLPPLVVSWTMDEVPGFAFLEAALTILLLGVALFLPVARSSPNLRLREGFMVVALFWTALGLAGALPLMINDATNLSFADAAFESISGLTTTGSTVLIGLDTLPYSLLLYRQELQWLGGMGIIVLAVAILPMLGVGGMQLYRAETPGPVKDAKLAPRITETAKLLWLIYVGLTILCALAYWVGGMDLFDAVAHAFATVSTGGYSTHDASFGFFESAELEMIAVVFMILGGTNFALHFAALQQRSVAAYLRDAEFRTYLLVVMLIAAITIAYLYFADRFPSLAGAAHHGVFQTVSITTSTGFTTTAFAGWPLFLPVLLIFASFMGGCASSTAGGMKVMRILILVKEGLQSMHRLTRPNRVTTVRLGGHSIAPRVVEGIWGFFAAYVFCFVLGLLILMARGVDQVTAFSAVAACINNLGPGLGEVASNFQTLDDVSKWTLSFAMLLGRLEIFTLLVLFTPDFWKP